MVGIGSGCIILVAVIGAVLGDWFTIRWTIVGLLGITALVMLGVVWATRARPYVETCARCHRPARDGLFCAWCGLQHATHPPRVLDDVSIEISGGRSSLLVPYGSALPFKAREEFSTAEDKQRQIGIHLVTGTDETPLRRTVAMFASELQLERPRATSKIVVDIAIDTTGEITLEITELGTDNKVHATGYRVPVTAQASTDTPDAN
jgi:hypothetical protein